jgi:hypothetical protein
MNTKELLQLSNPEQSKRLKQAGFNWKTQEFWYDMFGTAALKNALAIKDYHDNLCYPAPEVPVALKWMRDVKGLYGVVRLHYSPYLKKIVFCLSLNIKGNIKSEYTIYHTYEDAESALLDALLTLLEEAVQK